MVVGFIRVRVVSLGPTLEFIRCICVRLGSLGRDNVSSGSFGVRVGPLGSAVVSSGLFGFAWVHPVRTRRFVIGFIWVPVRSLRHALWSSGSLGFPWYSPSSLEISWVHSGDHISSRVHSRSRGFTPARLGVFGFIPVR